VAGLLVSPIGLPIPLAVLTYGCGFLQCVLKGAVAGDVPNVVWPGRHILTTLRYAGRWLFCFLAGPVALAGIAVDYWIHCGDPDFWDRLILIELGVAAVGYWLFAVLAVTRTDRLRDANPWRVAELVRGLGYRSAVAVAIASALAWINGWLMLGAVEAHHEEGFSGWLLLVFAWVGGLASAAFLLRLVGLWCFRAFLPKVYPVVAGERKA
jgi:hypothetical protein